MKIEIQALIKYHCFTRTLKFHSSHGKSSKISCVVLKKKGSEAKESLLSNILMLTLAANSYSTFVSWSHPTAGIQL